ASLSSKTVYITTCVDDDRRFTYHAISIPDFPGTPISQRSISMRWSSQHSINCSAESAVSTKSKCLDASKNVLSESRITRLSSIIARLLLVASMFFNQRYNKGSGYNNKYSHPKGWFFIYKSLDHQFRI